jgi:hypothetical protein
MTHSRKKIRNRIAGMILAAIAVGFAWTKLTQPRDPNSARHLNFKLFLMTVCDENKPPVFPLKLLEYEGQRVSLSGFMAAYDDPLQMNKILLTESAASCYFCNPPDANGVVFIRLSPKEKPPHAETGNITVEGTLHLIRPGCKDQEAKQFLYTLENAKITKFTP